MRFRFGAISSCFADRCNGARDRVTRSRRREKLADPSPQELFAARHVWLDKPKPQQVPFALGFGPVFILRALVQDSGVLQELHIAGLKLHVEIEGRVVGRPLDEGNDLFLRTCQARRGRVLLDSRGYTRE